MSQVSDNQARIAELKAQLNQLQAEEKAREQSRERAKIEAIRELSDEGTLDMLVEVCEEHGVTSTAEIARIFRMTGQRRGLDERQALAVIQWLRAHPQSNAQEIIAGTGCDPDMPRRLAARNRLLAWGQARGRRYSAK